MLTLLPLFGRARLAALPNASRMYRFARNEDIDLEELRTRLCKMTDEQLLRFGEGGRLRAIIIHQKKRARFLYRHLVKRGASPRQAGRTAYTRRGIWHRSHTPGMDKAYPNAWFATQWISLYDLWCIANPPVEVSDQLPLVF
jgi:hypothetical protein